MAFPTGRHVEFSSIVLNRFDRGVVVENWGVHDIPTLLEQLAELGRDLRAETG